MGESTESSFTALLTSLSRDPLTRGKQFERLTKWWLTQDPIWSRKVQNVWLWNEWPKYPGRDIGIDLVAQLTDGSLCAIQAKCFDENRDIPKTELDSFISAASHRTFEHRLLVATTDGLSSNARRMLSDQHVVRVMRSDLENSLDEWPSSIEHLIAPAQPKASPRPHQQRAIVDVVEGLNENSRGQLIMACGTGKTLTALWIKETLKPQLSLVLVPSLNLLAQTLSEWAKNSVTPWQYLCVCSDDTVSKSDDQPISTIDELPFEVTTKSEDIADFLSMGGEKTIFSTYQSSAQVAKAQKQAGTAFDLVICDEAHRLTGKTNADYATVLDERKIVAEKRLFMTATPRTYTPAAKSKAEERGVEITSMDDEHIYGPVLHKLSFGEAIKQDLLSDYRVLIVGVTDPQVQDLIDRRELVSVNNAVTTDARTLAAHIGLAKATKDYNLKRTISFHSRIKTADQFARDHAKILEWLPESHKPTGDTWTGTISGAMNTGDRRKLLTQLRLDGKDRHAILTNARCLTEGVDVPSLDGVAFIDPRSSQVDIIQAVGRAIRKSENKEIGIIVLPVLISTDSDAERTLENTQFKTIWAVLNALKSHDDELAAELRRLRIELGRTGNVGSLPAHVVEDLPADIDFLLENFSRKLTISILENSVTSWENGFADLVAFAESHGTSKVPNNYKTDSRDLYQWVQAQRIAFRSGTMTKERRELLDSLHQFTRNGTRWYWEAWDEEWNTAINALRRFANREGHSRIPVNHLEDGFELYKWVLHKRNLYKRRKSDLTLNEERISQLESLPGWTWNPHETNWQKNFEQLKDHLLATGQCHSFSSRTLRNWVLRQRRLFEMGELDQFQISKLESLTNWSWTDSRPDSWDVALSRLIRFVEREGRLPEQGEKEEGFTIGGWASNQRQAFKQGTLTQAKAEKLASLPLWSWDKKDSYWMAGLQAIRKFTEREGHSRVPQPWMEDGFRLDTWVQVQRRKFKSGSLQKDRIDQIQKVSGWEWDIDDAEWPTGVRELRSFALREGHTRLKRTQVENGFPLGAWIRRVRMAYNKGELSGKQIKELELVPNWKWNYRKPPTRSA